ncbi:MAG: hypothetical protein M1817_002273 [Caeruleum heppii]|nr:MAG: hypothetical protein M1817_002273 [Caeruleum heppii]
MFPSGPLSEAVPQLRTQQALLVLDVQNDFFSPDGKLPVDDHAKLLHRIKSAVPYFREAGAVFWIRSEFEVERSFNDRTGEGERVFTDDSVPQVITGTSTKTSSGTPSGALTCPKIEAFLSSAPSGRLGCCAPNTIGAAFPAEIIPIIDSDEDEVLIKTCYSALRDPSLLFTLRASLITELFICGAYSNISVYATAMDAARHGFSITLVEDCLGYRDEGRHEEAMKQMREYCGADVITSWELFDEIREDDQIPLPDVLTTAAAGDPRATVDLETLLEGLSLEQEAPTTKRTGSAMSKDSAISVSNMTPESELGDLKAHKTSLRPFQEEHRQSAESIERGNISSPRSVPETSHTAPDKASAMQLDSSPELGPGTPEGIAVDDLPSPQKGPKIEPLSAPISSVAARSTRNGPKRDRRRLPENLGSDQGIGEGDSSMMENLLPAPLEESIFAKVKSEVEWLTMRHRGGEVPRLVAVQAECTSDGGTPVYRHPADQAPPLLAFSPAVETIRDKIQTVLGQPFNHALIQCYRNGADYISEHSDKTLDVVRGSSIVNVSLGARRMMTLRTKKTGHGSSDGKRTPTRTSQKVPMPHNSMFVLGPQTNMRWLHGIRPDKRLQAEKEADDLLYDGERISLTFRQIGTFVDERSGLLWGQGARGKTRDTAQAIETDSPSAAEEMVRAFGRENQQTDFDWDDAYGAGFNVVDIITAETES